MKFKEYLSEAEEKSVIGLKINGKIIDHETSKRIWVDHFVCRTNQLTTLKGCPWKVIGDFYCNENKLTSLEGCPFEVSGNFYCNENKLTSLEGCPNKIGGSFSCNDNWLTSLEGCPSEVQGNFRCSENKLISLKDIHKHIKKINQFFGKSFFDCRGNSIRSHVLGLLLIENLTHIDCDDEWGDILNKHLGTGKAGLFDAQAELIDLGFEEYAKI